jgi:hypothetical protein
VAAGLATTSVRLKPSLQRHSVRPNTLGRGRLLGIGSIPEHHAGGRQGSGSPPPALPRGARMLTAPKAKSRFTLSFVAFVNVGSRSRPTASSDRQYPAIMPLANTMLPQPVQGPHTSTAEAITASPAAADAGRYNAPHARRCVYYPTTSILSIENHLLTVFILTYRGDRGGFGGEGHPQ